MDRVCQELRDQIVQLVEGDLGRAVANGLRAHAAACDACARELDREERLVRLLRTPVAIPGACVAVPDAELCARRPVRRLRRAVTTRRLAAVVAVAAAALVVVAVGLRGGRPGGGNPSAESPAGEPVARHPGTHRLVKIRHRLVKIRTIIDSTAEAPLPGDDLLALTAGVEAVVMRRPAQGR